MPEAPAAEPKQEVLSKPSAARAAQLPLIDGLGVNQFHVNFSGSSDLEFGQPRDRELIEAMSLGQRVRLTVDAYITDMKGHVSRGKEGDLNKVVKSWSMKVDSIEVGSFTILEEP